jgi:hypothetical protein
VRQLASAGKQLQQAQALILILSINRQRLNCIIAEFRADLEFGHLKRLVPELEPWWSTGRRISTLALIHPHATSEASQSTIESNFILQQTPSSFLGSGPRCGQEYQDEWRLEYQ